MARSSSAPTASRQRPWRLSNSSRCAVGPAPPFSFVHMHDVEPVVGARVIRGTIEAAQRGAEREPADPPHAVDADAHDQPPPPRGHAADRPISSSRQPCIAPCGRARRMAGRENLDPPAQAGVELVQQGRALGGAAGELGGVGQRPGAGHRHVAEIGADLSVQRVAERDHEIDPRRVRPGELVPRLAAQRPTRRGRAAGAWR